jgi:hypothetical protein
MDSVLNSETCSTLFSECFLNRLLLFYCSKVELLSNELVTEGVSLFS